MSILLLCFGPVCARAQYSFYGTINPTATIQPVMVLSVAANASNSIVFTSSDQYANGYSIPGFYSVAVKTNNPWFLYVSSATANFAASGTYATSNMPASIIGLMITGKTSGIQLTNASQLLSSGNRGDNADIGNSFKVDCTINPGFNYGPGIYSLTINYTLTAQ